MRGAYPAGLRSRALGLDVCNLSGFDNAAEYQGEAGNKLYRSETRSWMQRAVHELVFNRRFIKGKKTAGKVSSWWLVLDTIQLSECVWLKHAHHVRILSGCNKESHVAGAVPALMDFWVIWALLLDVVQTTRVRLQNGRVMEHLVERDAQEDDVELRSREGQYEVSRFSSVCFKIVQRKNCGLPALPNRAHNPMKLSVDVKCTAQGPEGTRQLHTCMLESFCHLFHYIHT